MKSIIILKFFALLSAAQDTKLPDCAVACINDATESSSDCKAEDYACACETDNLKAIQSEATPCVIKECGLEVATTKVISAIEAICKEAEGKGSSTATKTSAATSIASIPLSESVTSKTSETATAEVNSAASVSQSWGLTVVGCLVGMHILAAVL